MKAVRFHEYGEPDVLRHEDVAQPAPGAGQVRVRVAATTFNGVDGNIRAGLMQGPMPLTLPHIPGLDVAGTIDALGEGVTDLGVGDRVVGFLPFVVDGAAAEYVLAPAESLAPAPTSIPLADAAALPLVDHTTTEVGTAVTEPVDVLLNLAPIDPAEFAALATLVRDGSVVVNTTVWMPAPADEERGVRGIDLYVRSDAGQLSELVSRVDRGELTGDVAERVPLADLSSVHARAAAGTLQGKVIVVPSTT